MRNFWISFGVLLLTECSLLIVGSPVTTPTVEYLDSPSATEVVFDDSGSGDESQNGEEALAGTTELPLPLSDSEDSTPSIDLLEEMTTSIPCGNDLDSPDCSSSALVDADPSSSPIKVEDEIAIASKTETSSATPPQSTTISDEKTTTEKPK